MFCSSAAACVFLPCPSHLPATTTFRKTCHFAAWTRRTVDGQTKQWRGGWTRVSNGKTSTAVSSLLPEHVCPINWTTFPRQDNLIPPIYVCGAWWRGDYTYALEEKVVTWFLCSNMDNGQAWYEKENPIPDGRENEHGRTFVNQPYCRTSSPTNGRRQTPIQPRCVPTAIGCRHTSIIRCFRHPSVYQRSFCFASWRRPNSFSLCVLARARLPHFACAHVRIFPSSFSSISLPSLRLGRFGGINIPYISILLWFAPRRDNLPPSCLPPLGLWVFVFVLACYLPPSHDMSLPEQQPNMTFSEQAFRQALKR